MIKNNQEKIDFRLQYANPRVPVWRGFTDSLPLSIEQVNDLFEEFEFNDLFEKDPREFEYFYAVSRYYDKITILEMLSFITTARGNIQNETWGILEHERKLDGITFDEPYLEPYFKYVLNLDVKW